MAIVKKFRIISYKKEKSFISLENISVSFKKNHQILFFLSLILNKNSQFFIPVEQQVSRNVYVIGMVVFYYNIKKNINYTVISKKKTMFFILPHVVG